MGKSGGRFLKALSYLGKQAEIHLCAICDINSQNRPKKTYSDVPFFTDVELFLSSIREVDIIILAVNDHEHYNVLCQIRESGVSIGRILSEKPLTATLKEADQIACLFRENQISVNFVERFSPIVKDFLLWKRMIGGQIVRGEFFWGKNRCLDPRSTLGDLSEISHPIDLINCFFEDEVTSVEIGTAFFSESDFCPGHPYLLDSISAQMTINGSVPINGHSSFVWEARRRRIILFVRSEVTNDLYQVSFDFDKVHWDIDSLVIHCFDTSSDASTTRFITHQRHVTHLEVPQEIRKISKVYRFIEANLVNMHLLAGKVFESELVFLSGAVRVQEILEKLRVRMSESVVLKTKLFNLTTAKLSSASNDING